MNRKNKPESEMMGSAYDPHLSEGSAKVPIFQTSTFVFKNAEEGKAHFHIAYGLRQKAKDESMAKIEKVLSRSDELGLLSRSLNNMTKDLQYRTQKAENSSPKVIGVASCVWVLPILIIF